MWWGAFKDLQRQTPTVRNFLIFHFVTLKKANIKIQNLWLLTVVLTPFSLSFAWTIMPMCIVMMLKLAIILSLFKCVCILPFISILCYNCYNDAHNTSQIICIVWRNMLTNK